MRDFLVSVGVTVFNSEETIKSAVQSALAQKWRAIEIIAVDDYSSDSTYNILLELAAVHFELRVFRNSHNGGVAVSRNHILAEARGDFIVFFDDDDESLPDRISIQLNRILSYEKKIASGAPVICHTARKLIYPDGTERIEPTMGEREGQYAPNGRAVAERILLGTPLEDGYGACPTCSQMARLKTYRDLGGFDPSFRRSEDTEFNVRLAKNGGHFVGVSQPLVLQTMTKTSDKSLADERLYTQMLLNKHRDIADKYGMFDFCRNWIDIKFALLEGRKVAFVLGIMRQILRHPKLVYQRIVSALPTIRSNQAFSNFHRNDKS